MFWRNQHSIPVLSANMDHRNMQMHAWPIQAAGCHPRAGVNLSVGDYYYPVT